MMLTIFTATYNRGHLLQRLYTSLMEQECHDFEWLIVDDGSTDQTAEIVKALIQEQKINIRYLYKENGGKHTAHNLAVENAAGELFSCLDSDDCLAPNAVERIRQAKNELREQDCGFIGYKQDTAGKLLCSKFGESDAAHFGLFQYKEKQNIGGEFALVFRTELLKKYLFPVFENEKFIGECVLYDKLELEGYTFCPLKELLEICEYQAEGLSNHFDAVIKKNPAGYCVYYMQRIDLQKDLKSRLVTAGKYHCFRILAREQRSRYKGKYKATVVLAKPLGIAFYVYYKTIRGF